MHSESNVDISLQIFQFHHLIFVSIGDMNTFEESLCDTERNSVHLYGSSLHNYYNNETLGGREMALSLSMEEDGCRKLWGSHCAHFIKPKYRIQEGSGNPVG